MKCEPMPRKKKVEGEIIHKNVGQTKVGVFVRNDFIEE
jgi:hypothetical protein